LKAFLITLSREGFSISISLLLLRLLYWVGALPLAAA